MYPPKKYQAASEKKHTDTLGVEHLSRFTNDERVCDTCYTMAVGPAYKGARETEKKT